MATQDCRVEVAGGQVLSARKGLSFQSLNGLIARAELSSLVMLLDCCHGGSFVESAQAREKLSALKKTRYCLVTACRGFETAAAMKGEEHSIFSAAVLAALRADEQKVTALDVMRRVEQDLQGTGQEPLYVGAGSDVPILERRVVAEPLVSEDCPYQGLRAFEPETAKFFFGRDADVDLLVQKLDDSNFVPVLGPSGSGKSSVVRAGLVTRLRKQGWREIVMKPGDEPVANLKAELRGVFERQGISTGQQGQLMKALGKEGLRAMVAQWPEMGRVLLVVDQFEEVFTLCKRAVQQQFVGELIAVGRAASPLAVVMTMRSDFVDDWLRAGLSPEVIRSNTVWLGPLGGEDLAAAIVEPARKQGYELEPGLLRLLLADVEKEENCLPLLEFALTELWKPQEGAKRLTVNAYDKLGTEAFGDAAGEIEKLSGLKGALNLRATDVYNGLRESEQVWARKILLQLVRVGRGEKDTRQRQPKKLLLALGGPDDKQHAQARKDIACVIADLVKGGLLVSYGEANEALVSDGKNNSELEKGKFEGVDVLDSTGYVDLAHEALIEGWRQFVVWRQEDRDLRRLVQRMGDEYESWKRAKANEQRDEDEYLMKGGLLAEVREQREALSKELKESRPALMQYFADSDRKDAETVAMLQRALADADMRAASLKVRDKLLNNPAQTVEATLSAMALVGKSQEDFQGEVVHPAQDALHRVWFKIRERLQMEGHSDWVRSVAFSPQGDRIVSGSGDGTLRLWDIEGNAIGAPFEGHSGLVLSVAFSPQGDRIVSGSNDQTLRLWRVGTWEDELRYCCNTLMHHVALALPQDKMARQACEVCEQVWTRQQSAAFAVAQGSALARRGDLEGAVEKFERAKGLDPTLAIDSVGRARDLGEWASAREQGSSNE